MEKKPPRRSHQLPTFPDTEVLTVIVDTDSIHLETETTASSEVN